MTEDKDDKEPNRHGGILSVVDLREGIVPTQEVDKYLKLFEERDWKGIKNFGEKKKNYERKFVIKDYSELNLTPFSYDLSIGHQLFSIQRPDTGVITITEEQPYKLEPGETIVVITRELIAIPYYYSATVWPRFNMVRSGIFQSMVKIDPTWYGKLAVAMSNLSPTTLEIKRDTPFGTLLLYELSKPTDVDLWKNKDLEEIDLALKDELKPWKERLGTFLHNNRNLQSHCRLTGDVLKIKGIKRKQLEELESFDRNSIWKNFVEVIGNTWAEAKHSKTDRRMIGMEGLGMIDLEPILRGATHGERVDRKLIEIGECRQDELISAGVRYGKPFDLIANIPNLVMDTIDKEVIPRIRAEIEANIFPKIITLTLTVLGFLSLIIAVAAFLMDKYRPESPSFMQTDWSTTVSIGLFLLVAVLLVAFYILIFRKSPDSRAIRRLEKKIEKLKEELENKISEGKREHKE